MRRLSKNYLTDGLFLAGIFLLLAAITWRKWGYPWIDFGCEPFASWQLASGKVLYRDFFYRYGPFSQYLNAILFKIFGVSLTTFIFTNLCIILLFIAVIYRYFSLAAGRSAALMTSLSFLFLFAFAQYVYNGNYNYVVPYVAEATHGLLWSLTALLCFSCWIYKPRAFYAGAAGLCVGFALLTKPEFAAAFILPAAFFPFFIINPLEKYSRHVFLFAVFAALPFLGFLIYFSLYMPWPEALQAAGGGFDLRFTKIYSQNVFFAAGSGMDKPLLNFVRMMMAFLGLLGLFGVTAFLDIFLKNAPARIRLYFSVLFSLAAGIISLLFLGGGYRALPFVVFSLCFFVLKELAQEWRAQKRRMLAALLLWGLFSLGLLFKILFHSRIHHYGFVLAMPAVLFAAACLMETIPGRLNKNFGTGSFFRRAAAGILFLIFFFNFFKSLAYYSQKNFPVGDGGDRIYAFAQEEDKAMTAAMTWLKQNAPAGATLSMIPQGQMVNYLLRMPDPTHYPLFLFPAVLSQGEQVILENFQNARPDYIVIAPMNWSDYGIRYFGDKPGYGKSLIDWVKTAYREAASFGEEPGKPPLVIYARP